MTAPQPNLVKNFNSRLEVAFLPSLVQPDSLRDRTVVVTDVLRATTTIVNALANGCRQVIPRPSIESARQTHLELENSVLGGERGGRIVEGFHNGNSPIEYTQDVIGDKSLILATTNGTVAMEHCRTAKRVLIGAMINLTAISEQIDDEEPVTVVCSGTDGFITSEDVIFAGALMHMLAERNSGGTVRGNNGSPENNGHHELSDMAKIAANHWRHTSRMVDQGTEMADFFRKARGGINLVRIGHDDDIVFASQVDTVPVVPELDVEQWKIRTMR